MKTYQTGSENAPPKTDYILAFIMKCPECGTQRAFKVNDSVALVLARQSSGVEYGTWCRVCKHRFVVQLCWTKRHVTWVSEELSFQKAVTIEDNIAMNTISGKKQI